MKRLVYATSALLVLVACAPQLSSRQTRQQIEVADRGYDYAIARNVNQASNTVIHNADNPSNMTLADLIRKTSGVYVTGNDADARVRVSGISSFQGSDPLFVLNGNPVGSDFRQVYSLVNPNDVVAITVLKGNDAAIYGSRGGFGVVVIRTN